MKKPIQRILSIVLVLMLVLTALPANAMAQMMMPQLPSVMQTAQTEIHHNPLYEGLVEESALQLPEVPNNQAGTAATDASDYLTEEGAVEQLRAAMVGRQGTCVVNVASTNSNHNALMESLFHRTLTHTGNPVEGDYLAWQYGSWRAGSSYYDDGSTYYYTSTFTFTYYTDAEKEALMDTEVAKLLEELALDDLSDYNKVKGIYDYICANVTYDYDNLYDSTYLLKHSAYAALIDKTAVCQGYALLMYRLALEVGVDCRLIAGKGGGEPHGWNIVKLGDLYYNLDSTWDAGQSSYSYFLVSDVNFPGHTRGNYESSNGIDYTADSFCSAYPVSPENYVLRPEDGRIVNGVCGENLTWQYSEATGALTISGTGDMYDFTGTTQPWEDYTQDMTSVTFAEGVTSVGDYAFFHCYDLKKVKLASSITSIGNSAFLYCSSLETLELPEQLKTIADHAFVSCGKLTGMEFPAGLTTIGETAFSGTALTRAVLPEGLTTIGEQAFLGCPLTEVSLPATLTSLGYCAFQDTAPLAGIAVAADNPVYCGDRQGAVYTKDMTTLIVVPAGYSGAFVIPDGVTELEDCALRNCDLLTGVQFPASVTTIGRMAFYDSDSLNNVVLPEAVTVIPRSAFAWCDGLSSILLPEGLTAIAQSAFLESTALKKIVLPAALETLETGAFRNSAVETLIFRGDAPVFADDTVLYGVTASAYYPGDNETWTEEMRQNYGGAITWIAGITYTILPDSVTDIEDTGSETVILHADGALSDFVAVHVDGAVVDEANYTLTEGSTIVTFTSAYLDTLSVGSHSVTLEFIDGYATGTIRINAAHVHDYYYHTELTLPTCTEQGYTVHTCQCGDSYVGSYTAPKGHSYEDGVCTGCGEVDPDAPVKIPTSGSCGENVFWSFDEATGTLTISGEGPMADYEGQIYLPWKDYLEKVTSFVVEPGVTSVGAASCVGMTRLQNVTLPEGVTAIGDNAFSMTALQQITLPESLKTIGAQAFSDSDLTSITIPAGVETIGQMAFFFCGDLTEITFLGNAPALPGGGIFVGVTAMGYYPGNNATWTPAARTAFGGNIAWVAVSGTAPVAEGVYRIAGADRIETSLGIADALKETLGVSNFSTMIVASALNFPDALTGSYLAAVKSAPILLTYDRAQNQILEYISANLAPGGLVYILGGESAVSAGFEKGLTAMGVNAKRLAGADRFGTNLEILKEAGVDNTLEMLICTATGFADSLSASAAGLPILLVHGSLTQTQKEFLAGTSGEFVIIGGVSAVSASLESELRALGSVERLGGASRYETSVLVAQRFVRSPGGAVLAYARNYPDGLCGGPLSVAMNAPLILTDDYGCAVADDYVADMASGIVVGGPGLISDDAVRTIFDLSLSDDILLK